MRILITGGFGCIGAWAIKRLVGSGHAATIFDLREDWSRVDLILDSEERAAIGFIAGDVSDPAAVRAVVEQVEATHILHLAGLQVPTCRADPILGAKVNVIGTLAVFEAAAASGGRVERVVYASSAAVYGPPEAGQVGSLPDAAGRDPRTHYGAYKVCNELNARTYWLERGIPSVGLRPWTVYGVGRDLGVTSEPTKAILAAARGQDYAISYGGLQDLQYVADVADTFLLALERPFQGADAFNLRGAVVPIEEFVRTLAEVAPSSAGRITYGERSLPIAPDLDDSRLEAAFGPLPRTALEEGIQCTYNIFRNR